MADVSGITEKVSRAVTVDASAAALISGFQGLLAAGIAAAVKANDDIDLTELNKLSADLAASSDALQAAVTANTPAAEEPPPDPVP